MKINMLWFLLPAGVGLGAFFASMGKTISPASFGPSQIYGPPMQSQIDNAAFALFRSEVEKEEGHRLDVYKDHLGYLTVGIGHKVLPGDNLKFGNTITEAKVQQFFNSDTASAFAAAKKQAIALGKYNVSMLAALSQVCYQHGNNWNFVHFNTWSKLKAGNVQGAIANLRKSLWYKQTPNRVVNFIAVLQTQYA